MRWQELETYAFVHFGLNTYNDLEWGYGNTPISTFAPDTLDVEQWVRTFVASGMKGVILTAKHHDGFCLWPTKTTEYSVKNSPWKGGKGDLVRELSDACRKYGLRFGLYLSPWDRNHAEYGREEYQRIFHEQIRELTTGYGELFEYWFDGANGGSGWYGGADESRAIDPASYYRYEDAAEILRANNPDVMIFGGTVPTIRWIGNESGWAGETNYSAYDFSQESHYRDAQWGMRDAQQWLPGEVDVSIRPGWFYHAREDHQVRSVANLTNLYFQSVGRNANLLLNFPVALDGRIPQTDSLNAVRWHEHIRTSFEHNVLRGTKVSASNSRSGSLFTPEHLTDSSRETYWATEDSTHTAEIVVDFARARINTIELSEYIKLGQRIDAFKLETRDSQGQWQPVATTDSLTTIGYKRLIRFSPTETTGIRLSIAEARGAICLSEIGAYFVPELVEAPVAFRDADDKLVLSSTTRENTLRYRVGNGAWQPYTTPVALLDEHTTLEAQAVSSDGKTASTRLSLGYRPSRVRVLTPTLSADEQRSITDGDGFSAATLPEGVREISLQLDRKRKVRRIEYIPSQHRDAPGHISQYELYLDGKLVAQGEFANIKHNPLSSSIILPQTRSCRSVRLVVRKLSDDTSRVSIGSILIH